MSSDITRSPLASPPLEWWEALESGNLARVQGLLYERELVMADLVEAQDDSGNTALHVAVLRNNLELARYLIETCHANVEVRNYAYNNTPLLQAAWMESWDMLKLLVQLGGANVDVRNSNGHTALMLAIYSESNDMVRCLVELGQADTEATDREGKTALILAASLNAADIVESLLNTGRVNVTAKDMNGGTALILAIQACYPNVVRCLVELGSRADIETKGNYWYGHTPLMLCCRTRRHREQNTELASNCMIMAQMLVQVGAANVEATDNNSWTALMHASHADHTEMIEFLAVTCRASVEARDEQGRTALMLAAGNNDDFCVDAVRTLVDICGAEVEATDNEGQAAFLVACRNYSDRLDMIQYLVDTGRANVNASDENNCTALMHCRHKKGLIQLLIATGRVDIEARSRGGATALFDASEYGNMDVAQCLVKQGGAIVNVRDATGRTPFMVAGTRQMAHYLMTWGANVNATDHRGGTALHFGCEHNRFDVVQYLVERGEANVNATTHNGQTALHMACSLDYGFCLNTVVYLVTVVGINPNTKDSMGNTSLHLASQHRSRHALALVLFLVEHWKG